MRLSMGLWLCRVARVDGAQESDRSEPVLLVCLLMFEKVSVATNSGRRRVAVGRPVSFQRAQNWRQHRSDKCFVAGRGRLSRYW